MAAWILAAALGTSVGVAELVTRYRDQPSALPRAVSFWVYILLNAGASLLAYSIIRTFNWTFSLENGFRTRRYTGARSRSFGHVPVPKQSLHAQNR
jgi:hypothetical protein